MMIILKIKQPGHTLAIPGLPAFRSPVEVDISKLDVRVVAMYLKTSGIEKYEIVAETPQQKEVYTKEDFEVVETKKENENEFDWKKRFNRLENMLENLLTQPRNESNFREQTTNKTKIKNEDPHIEELASFIPEVDISEMTIQSSDNIKKIKQDKNIEDSVDILAGLMKKK